MRRPFVVCYICGREFGSASIGIHEPQCLKKWYQQNDLRPKEERLPPPVKPEAFMRPSAGNAGVNSTELGPVASSFDEAAAMAASANLAPCPKCGRTFNPERLAKHKSVCKPNNQNRLPNNNNFNNKTRFIQQTSAQSFLLDLERHLPSAAYAQQTKISC
ncbi:hypothetical protein CRM22_008498 [Opisthorchis felineus]|uniref:C2HC/C3H-type domain-containing protein n=1 Tax=Opisthorchis felineus TaxID=147828 RepID=A0A4S2LB28_OPIFE|nr:hypothetical protein CRM22_008498 [Opisthorchis felineus]